MNEMKQLLVIYFVILFILSFCHFVIFHFSFFIFHFCTVRQNDTNVRENKRASFRPPVWACSGRGAGTVRVGDGGRRVHADSLGSLKELIGDSVSK